jgi:hypothetical protein
MIFVIEISLNNLSMKTINAIFAAVAFITADSIAAAQSPALSEAAERFIARHSDYAATLETEALVALAIKNNDAKFLIDAGKQFEKDTLPFTRENHPERQGVAVRLGPCHYASILISGVPHHIARELGTQPKRKAVRIKALVPEDVVLMFEENITRCERLSRLPKSVRSLHPSE